MAWFALLYFMKQTTNLIRMRYKIADVYSLSVCLCARVYKHTDYFQEAQCICGSLKVNPDWDLISIFIH